MDKKKEKIVVPMAETNKRQIPPPSTATVTVVSDGKTPPVIVIRGVTTPPLKDKDHKDGIQ